MPDVIVITREAWPKYRPADLVDCGCATPDREDWTYDDLDDDQYAELQRLIDMRGLVPGVQLMRTEGFDERFAIRRRPRPITTLTRA